MPKWIEEYSLQHNYKSSQITRHGEVGFWISNWRVYPMDSRPFVTPNVKGAIKKFESLIPDSMEHLRQKIEMNRQVIINQANMVSLTNKKNKQTYLLLLIEN